MVVINRKLYLENGLVMSQKFISWTALTRGIDIGVKAFMYQLMYRLKKEGKSILMISEELPELIGMSDRILIMKDGQIQDSFTRSEELNESVLIKKMV